MLSACSDSRPLFGAEAFDLPSASASLSLRVAVWTPPTPPRAVLFLVHGLSEHVGRWAQRAAWLADQLACVVVAADHRGHGLSGGERTHITGESDLLADLVLVVSALSAARNPNSQLPTIVMGHSMGGLLAAAFVQFSVDRTLWPAVDQSVKLPPIRAYVLSAPAMVSDQAWLLQKLAPVAAFLLPTLRLSPSIQGSQLAADDAVGKAYFADPLVSSSLALTASFGKNLLAFMESARAPHRLAAMARSDCPRGFVYHGKDDTLVPIRASELLAAAIPSLTFVPLPNTRHEAQFEPVADEIFAQVVQFFKVQLEK
jgi:alpha-beta hydrolase superfamily lysophospholipase